ncbi:MAG: putative selenocysteine system protein [Promethearchaeota archaeon]
MIIEQFEKVKKNWSSNESVIPYADTGISKKSFFEIAYHAANEVPFRCIHVVTKPGDDEEGNKAVIYSSLDKIFTSINGTENAIILKMYVENDTIGFEKLEKIVEKINNFVEQFKNRSDNLKDQITKTILIERKIDEVVNLAMNRDISRKVYFAIGETRERGALIPLMMNAQGADVVQLAIMKWMNSALNDPQDDNFPAKKIKGLVKNFLKIKGWMQKLIDRSFTAPEKELLEKKEQIIEEGAKED